MSADRKALARAYRETPRTMGIGAVRNTASGKVLLVASNDLPALLNRQRAQLKLGAHPNHALQQDWNAAGPDAFSFDVVDVLKPADTPDYDPTEDLRTLEALWLEKLRPFEPDGYHRRPK